MKEQNRFFHENQDMIKLIVDALLERETITKEQIDYLVEHGTMPPEDDEEQVDRQQRRKRCRRDRIIN